MSIWEEEIKDLTLELNKALKRGVVLTGIYFGENNPYESLVPHRRFRRHLTAKKERYLSVTIDGIHTISGIASRGEHSKATWTQDEGLVEVSEDYIVHDLVLNLYSASLNKEDFKRFEEFSDSVYKKYFNYSDEEFAIYKNNK